MINRNEKGSSALEFALVAVLFFTVLFSIFEYAIMSYINLTMQHAVREGTRYAVTGRQDMDEPYAFDVNDPETHWLEDKRFNAMVEKIKSQSMGFFDRVLDPEDIVITDADEDDTPYQNHNWNDTNGNGLEDEGEEGWDYYYPGDADNIIVVKLNCTWPVITPLLRPFFSGGEYNFTVASTMKNELFE